MNVELRMNSEKAVVDEFFFFPENNKKDVKFFYIEHTCITDADCMFSV